MNEVVVKSRIDPGLKADAELVLEELGLSVSDVIRLTFRQIVARRGLPFDVKLPNDVTIAAIKEARAMRGSRFKTSRDMFNGLKSKARS